METRAKGRSAGSDPLRCILSMADLRLTSALTDRSRHTGSSGAAPTTSRSSAKSACIRGLGEQPAGVAQPHLVRHKHENCSGKRPLSQPPEPLGESRPVGRGSLPDDTDGPSVGKDDGGVHRHGAVPAEADGMGQVRYGGGQAIYDSHGVDSLQEYSPPPGRDRVTADQVLQGRVFVLGQAAQACGG